MNLTEEPIILNKENDFLGSLEKANTIAEFIETDRELLSKNNMIAIYGEWGNGKSSLMKTIAEKLENGKYEKIWIDMWKEESDYSNLSVKILNRILEKIELDNMDNNTEKQNNKIKETYAYISGCFNNSCQRYGYAGLIFHEGEKYIIKGNGDEPNLIKMGSVGSQILASKETIKKAIELEIRNIDIYYDYDGVKKWANGEWNRNLKETEDYYNFIQEIEPIININFVKNKKLLSIPERNEVVDLAKKEAHCKIEKMNKNNNDRNIDEIKNINKASKKLNKKKLRRKRNFQQFELKKLPDYIRTIFEE